MNAKILTGILAVVLAVSAVAVVVADDSDAAEAGDYTFVYNGTGYEVTYTGDSEFNAFAVQLMTSGGNFTGYFDGNVTVATSSAEITAGIVTIDAWFIFGVGDQRVGDARMTA